MSDPLDVPSGFVVLLSLWVGSFGSELLGSVGSFICESDVDDSLPLFCPSVRELSDEEEFWSLEPSFSDEPPSAELSEPSWFFSLLFEDSELEEVSPF